MKKTILFLIILGLLLTPILCLAEGSVCVNGHSIEGGTIWQECLYTSPVTHAIEQKIICPQCGEITSKLIGTEKHHYKGSSCSDCGCTRPDKSILTVQALEFGEEAKTHSFHIIWPGDICDEAAGKTVSHTDILTQYIINDYELSGQTPWIEVCRLDNPEVPVGWVKGETGYISPRYDYDIHPDDLIMITIAAGNGRTGPGTENAFVTNVHYGEYYRVREVRESSIGVLWCKLNVHGVECWVSGRMCEVWNCSH